MNYTALARKWRPRSFEEMTGQEHVLQALTNALTTGRVHHAFLFTGTRGVGKTTVARILAKCLNCETGVTARPCGVCGACREIDEGRFLDLVEVDAASRTRIDDTRELLDNVQYAPTAGRYKIYLIDEVHMLSQHSFNALLKTLEEPPPHVKFLLATTDPQKLPVTVLSRCLQFNLKRLPVAAIAERMKIILGAEQVPFDAPALRLVALAADGSLRDALSLLDQLIAFGGGRVEEEPARAMLGTVDRGQVVRLVELLAAGAAGPLLAYARTLEQWAPDYAQMLDDLAALLAQVALRQAVPDYEGDELHPAGLLADFAGRIAAEDLQLYYQTAILGRRDLPLAPDERTGFEMTLLRMIAFRPATAQNSARPAGGTAAHASVPAPRSAAGSDSPPQSASAVKGAAAPEAPAQSASAPAPLEALTPEAWPTIVAALGISGPARQLAAQCALLARSGAGVQLALAPGNQPLRTPAQIEKLEAALSRHFGTTLRVSIDVAAVPVESPALADERRAALALAAARDALESDPTVRALRDQFGASLQAESVRPRRS
jgi:DNA polymerase-3 subunit gamma/tau